MKKLIVLLLFINLTGLWAAPVFGAEEMSDNTKWRLYLSEAKNPWAAVFYSLFPGGGHLYAGDWKRGAVFFGTYILSSVWVNSVWINEGPYSNNYALASGVFSGILIFGMFDAYNSTEKYNASLRQKYELNVQVRNNLPVLAYTYQF